MTEINMQCFCCGIDCGTFHSPDNATYWQSSGNYGSKVFDSFNSKYIQLFICDNCLTKNQERVITVCPQPKPKRKYKMFRGINDHEAMLPSEKFVEPIGEDEW